MKKSIFFRTLLFLVLSTVLMQALPVLASDGVRIYTTDMQTAELSSYEFRADATDFSKTSKYCDQLKTDDQRALYDNLLSAVPNRTVSLKLSEIPALPLYGAPGFSQAFNEMLSEIVLPAYAAAVMDEPMLFWTGSVGYSATFSITSTGKIASLIVNCTPQVSSGFNEMNYKSAVKQIGDIIEELPFRKGDRESMLRQFHDYLCDTIVYIDSARAHNIYGALVEGEAVCEGYAKSLKLFCDLYDIPCMIITGLANTSSGYGPHAWNAVRMEDGKWYGIDVTWDDQGEIYYDFFLVGSESVPASFKKITFAQSHIADSDYYGNGSVLMNFPTLSEQAYVKAELVYGDSDSDGVIDGKDVTNLLQYLVSYDDLNDSSDTEISKGADTNGDGKIDGRDVVRLLRYIACFDEETGESSIPLGPQ